MCSGPAYLQFYQGAQACRVNMPHQSSGLGKSRGISTLSFKRGRRLKYFSAFVQYRSQKYAACHCRCLLFHLQKLKICPLNSSKFMKSFCFVFYSIQSGYFTSSFCSVILLDSRDGKKKNQIKILDNGFSMFAYSPSFSCLSFYTLLCVPKKRHSMMPHQPGTQRTAEKHVHQGENKSSFL